MNAGAELRDLDGVTSGYALGMARWAPEGLLGLELRVAGRRSGPVIAAIAARRDLRAVSAGPRSAVFRPHRTRALDSGVQRLVEAIDGLPEEARSHWDGTSLRRVEVALAPVAGRWIPGGYQGSLAFVDADGEQRATGTTARLAEGTVRRMGFLGLDLRVRIMPVVMEQAGRLTMEPGGFMEVIFEVRGSRRLAPVGDHIAWVEVVERAGSTIVAFRGFGRNYGLSRSLRLGLQTVESFPAPVRARYDAARARIADVGYTGSAEGVVLEGTLPADLLRRLGAAGFALHVTTYPPSPA